MKLRGLDVVQYAWVVDSLERAMAGWLDMGMGPFHTMELSWDEAIHRGRTTPLAIRVGLAQAGATQIELIEQTSPGPSVYRDVVPEGQTGFHHVCVFRDDVEQYRQSLADDGVIIAGILPRAGGDKTYYADTRDRLGCMLEVLSETPSLRAIYALVASTARQWDGEEPIRPLTPQVIAGTLVDNPNLHRAQSA